MNWPLLLTAAGLLAIAGGNLWIVFEDLLPRRDIPVRTVTIVNQTKSVTPGQLAAVVAALQLQVTRDFGPAWGIAATIAGATADPAAALPPSAQEQILLLDSIDQAGALGYHLDQSNGVPRGYVAVETSGNDWPATLSHELLEQLLDPLAACLVRVRLGPAFGRDAGRVADVAYEAADAVEDDEYQVNDFSLSNFILPDWFTPGSTGPFDFMHLLTAPLALRPGGYVSYAISLNGWRQVTDRKGLAGDKHPLSRYHRRRSRHKAARGRKPAA